MDQCRASWLCKSTICTHFEIDPRPYREKAYGEWRREAKREEAIIVGGEKRSGVK